jgi:hypothetical protein
MGDVVVNWNVFYGFRRYRNRAPVQGPTAWVKSFGELKDANAFAAQCRAEDMYAQLQPTPAMKKVLESNIS